MWFITAALAQSVVLPPNTPIPCLVCKASLAETSVFSGTVQFAQPGLLRVFNAKTRQTIGFSVPENFRGVESSDGKIKDAPIARLPAGLLARVTYRTVDDRNIVTRVLVLTINQCRALMAAERLNNAAVECPD